MVRLATLTNNLALLTFCQEADLKKPSPKKKRPRRATATAEVLDLAEGLNRVVTHLMRRLRRVDDRQPVPRARLSALSVLVFGGPRTLSQLADDEGVTTATMHHVVQGLLDDGLAGKRDDPADRRKIVIEATVRGRDLMLRARAARLDLLAEGIATLSDAERRNLKRSIAFLGRWTF